MNQDDSVLAPFDVVYREGETVRKLRGHVHDIESLGFVKIDGFSKQFWLNPRYIERIELRGGDQ